MEFKSGDIVCHVSRKDWGFGLILEVLALDKVSVKFSSRDKQILIKDPKRWLFLVNNNSISNCIICNEQCMETNLLSNGAKYHANCYKNIIAEYGEYELIIKNHLLETNILKNRKKSLHNKIVENNKKIKELEIKSKSNSYINLILTFLKIRIENACNVDKINKFKTEVSTACNEIIEIDKEIIELERKFVLELGYDCLDNNQYLLLLFKPPVKMKLKLLYDYWLSYPPDWEDRRDDLIEDSGGRCSFCGDTSFLHVHHIQPISQGGSHLPENLIVLCESCHSLQHGSKSFSYNEKSNKTDLMLKIDEITNAIKNTCFLSFHYRKYNGEKSVRKIKPMDIINVGGSICVKGYCYTRNAERIFAIKRMSRIKMIKANSSS